MSTPEAHSEDKKKSMRRRRPSGNRKRGPKPEGGAAESNAAPRKETVRPVSAPVPAELIGKTSKGVVTAIIRRGRLKFGFIHIGDETKPETPRIYFSFLHLKDSDTIFRKGYAVQFRCDQDDKGRAYAADIELTEEGKVGAAAREAVIAARRSEGKPEGAGAETEKRPRRPRKPVEEKKVTLKVTCDGKSGEKNIEIDLNQSVGKLKNITTTEFEAPVHYNVFHVTKANPAGEFLTKAILNTLNAGDHIHLGEPKEPVVAK